MQFTAEPRTTYFSYCRYTTDASATSVFAIALKWPDNYTLNLGAVKPDRDATITLLGYGKVQWTYSQSVMTVTMPFLPLDSPLQWAWTLKMEGVLPVQRRGKTRKQNMRRND